MAFVCRSERMLSDSKNNPNVGPGSYLGPIVKQMKFNKVPFQSKSNWNLSTVDSYTPGK